ncbi:MAG: hypothetical protein ACREJM_12810, partial [Candidatus Saccharimonadales bacterium]
MKCAIKNTPTKKHWPRAKTRGFALLPSLFTGQFQVLGNALAFQAISLLLSLAALLLAPATTSANDSSASDEAPRGITFDVAISGDSLLLPIRVKEKESLFQLSTGSTMTSLDDSFRPMLGRPL